MTLPHDRPRPGVAGPELLVLAQFEEFVSWFLARTAKWPKSARFTLTQRIENLALDVLEALVLARYRPGDRKAVLEASNLKLERMRHLLRIALKGSVCPHGVFESSMRGLDEVGRMLHGWRSGLAEECRA